MALIPDSPASTSPVPRVQVHATISTLLAHLKFRFLLITTAVHNVGFLHFSMSLWHAASHTLCLCSSALGTPVPVWPWICSVFRILVSLDPRHPKFLPQATPLPSLGHRFTEVLMNIISWAGPVPGEVHVSDSRASWHRLAIPATQETAAGKLGFQSEFKSCLSNIVRLKRANGKVQRNIAQWWSVCLTHGRP